MVGLPLWKFTGEDGSALIVVVIAAMRTRRANPLKECVSGQCDVAGYWLNPAGGGTTATTQGIFQELLKLRGFGVKSTWRVPCVMVGIHNIVDWSIRPGGVFQLTEGGYEDNLTARVVFFQQVPFIVTAKIPR